jgi:predicted nuclease with TOPRIM domain
MGKKKEFWELADSTILGRYKKVDLLQTARAEHGKVVEAHCAQSNLQAKQINDLKFLCEQLKKEEGVVHKQALRDLMQQFDGQQHNHEQELTRLENEARDWENLAQDYKATAVYQESVINSYKPVVEKVKLLSQMNVKDAVGEFVEWLFSRQTAKPYQVRKRS